MDEIWEAPLKIVYDEDMIIFGGNYNDEEDE
jgi:hypothetical protein